MNDDLLQRLHAHLLAYLIKHYPSRQEMSIQQMERMPAGWESDLYSFIFSYEQDGMHRSEALVLRIYPGDNATEKARHEYKGMQLIYNAGYPVPMVYAVESQPSPIGRAFVIMELIQGEVMWSLIEQSTPQRQSTLLDQLCGLFVRLHNLDWRSFTDDPDLIERSGKTFLADGWIANVRRGIETNNKHEFLPVLDWIDGHRNDMHSERASLIHHDFHPNNVIVRPDGSAVVIDWSGWQVTDFRFDLGWTLLLAGAYIGTAMRQYILAAYEKASGMSVENIEVFEVCACLRRLFDITASLSHGAESQGMRPEAADLMRSQMGPFQYIADLLHAYTGITIPEVETLLNYKTGFSRS